MKCIYTPRPAAAALTDSVKTAGRSGIATRERPESKDDLAKALKIGGYEVLQESGSAV